MPLFRWRNRRRSWSTSDKSGVYVEPRGVSRRDLSLEEQSERFDRFLEWIGSDVSLAGQLFREVVSEFFNKIGLVRGKLEIRLALL